MDIRNIDFQLDLIAAEMRGLPAIHSAKGVNLAALNELPSKLNLLIAALVNTQTAILEISKLYQTE